MITSGAKIQPSAPTITPPKRKPPTKMLELLGLPPSLPINKKDSVDHQCMKETELQHSFSYLMARARFASVTQESIGFIVLQNNGQSKLNN